MYINMHIHSYNTIHTHIHHTYIFKYTYVHAAMQLHDGYHLNGIILHAMVSIVHPTSLFDVILVCT